MRSRKVKTAEGSEECAANVNKSIACCVSRAVAASLQASAPRWLHCDVTVMPDASCKAEHPSVTVTPRRCYEGHMNGNGRVTAEG